MFLTLIFLGFLVGLSLGLTGGGGAIFAVPLLVYGAHAPLSQATVLSIFIVGTLALFGTLLRLGKNTIDYPRALAVAITGILTAPLGQFINRQLSPKTVLLSFTLLMIVIAAAMWKKGRETEFINQKTPTPLTWKEGTFLATVGLIVGFLTGFFGIGGGFLIVPLLIFAGGLAMEPAIATSLVTIVMISCSAFISSWNQETASSIMAYWPFLAGGGLGMAFGTSLSEKVQGAMLSKAFALLVFGVAMASLYHLYIRF